VRSLISGSGVLSELTAPDRMPGGGGARGGTGKPQSL
jgi:hypothetical protein